MPLTSGNVTIKTSGGSYSSWAAFWDDLGNLTGDITCTVDASAFTEATAPSEVTESLNGHTLHVLPVSFPTTTDGSTGARFTCNYVGAILQLNMAGAGTVIIEGIVLIEGTSRPVNAIYINNVTTNYSLIFRRNIIKGCNLGINISDTDMTGLSAYNNIIFDHLYQAIDVVRSTLLANNTVVDGEQGYELNNVAQTIENCLAYSCSYRGFYTVASATGNNNADSGTSCEDADFASGANNITSISDPFNALASDDFTITAEGVIGTAGKDLSASFTDDFFGVTRSNWTIGACEFAVADTPAELTVNPLITATITDVIPAVLSCEAAITASWIETYAAVLTCEPLIVAGYPFGAVLLVEAKISAVTSDNKQTATSTGNLPTYTTGRFGLDDETLVLRGR